jgi:hypothetical protein
MQSSKGETPDTIIQTLWNAIFAGTRLKHVGPVKDPRVFVLKSIIWGNQETKVIDVDTGEVFRFPWTELEFLDPVESNIPGFPPVPKIS